VAWNIVIAGGGFGGFYAARTLERVLPPHSARVTLVSEVNFLLFTPLLPGAAAGTLEPRHVVVPLREQLPRADLWLGRVAGAELQAGELIVDSLDGRRHELRYDQLIVALGSISRTQPIPGLVEHAIGFKTLAEAIALRNRVISMLEIAETIHDAETRAEYLTFVFVGAGYAGLEGVAELQDFMGDVLDMYPRCKVQGMRWVLLEARERVLPEVAPSLAAFAARELRGRGIEIHTGVSIERVGDRSLTLSDGRSIPARTVVWTAGVRPHPVIAQMGLPLAEGGRVAVDRTMRVDGHANVWAIGDAAAVPDPARKGASSPPTAQHAIRQGRRVARNVAAELGAGGRVRPFKYRTLGVFVDLGRHQAVASTLGIRWRGFPAWFLARSYHMANMPGTKRKLRLLVDWTVALLFSRDTSELGQLGHPPGLEGANELPPQRAAHAGEIARLQ
jgi:NADH dehydrogenase